MTRTARITYMAAAVLGLAVGLAVGLSVGWAASDAAGDAQRLIAAAELGDYSYLQYRYAQPQYAKKALLTYVAFLEQLERLKPQRTQQLDLSLAYTRLSLLEDAEQNIQQSQAYMEKGERWYRAYGGGNFSADKIKAGVRRLDEHLQR